ncbi:hypothetical protein A9K55_004717 [Cordyceps militaris]|uniref:Uncharacterized protein n=1 Tax=Cordyceps militaris TaxID=73501 RepID=A0A2H4SLP0_CORMI|nr:hypothetical protein A9K55_004717 [Cordyceps militaris]
MTEDPSPTYTVSGIHWFALSATIALLCCIWWVSEVPSLFAPGPRNTSTPEPGYAPGYGLGYGGYECDEARPAVRKQASSGLGNFARSVMWSCLRSLQPGFVVQLIRRFEYNHKLWAVRYYFGPGTSSEYLPRLSAAGYIGAVLTEMTPLVIQAVLIYVGSTAFDQNGNLLIQFWIIGLLPSAVTGLCIMLTSCLPRSAWRAASVVFFLSFLALTASLIVAAVFTASGYGPFKYKAVFGIVMAAAWLLHMVLSIVVGFQCSKGVHCIALLLTAALRVAPMILLAVPRGTHTMPYPGINPLAFSIAISVVAGGIVFALGATALVRCPVWDQRHVLTRRRRRNVRDPRRPRYNDPRRRENDAHGGGGGSGGGGGDGGGWSFDGDGGDGGGDGGGGGGDGGGGGGDGGGGGGDGGG